MTHSNLRMTYSNLRMTYNNLRMTHNNLRTIRMKKTIDPHKKIYRQFFQDHR